MSDEQDWSRLHGGLPVTRLVALYLRVINLLAVPVARTRVHPDVLTFLAVCFAAAALVLPLRVAALAIGVSALFDALDGAVAVRQGRASRWGYVLDSLADRVSEWLFLGVLVRAGAPASVAVACAFLILLLEYARARSGNAGGSSVGALTVGERPVRVVLPVIGLLTGWVALATWVLAVTTAVGLVHLLVVLRRQLGSGSV